MKPKAFKCCYTGILEPGPRAYDITPDGKYFVVLLPKAQANTGKAPPEQINVTLTLV
jgi:hypothetical protein